MGILSVQSRVVFGHVGNSAAAFALERRGHAVWAVDTVRLSNHPGHGVREGGAADAAEVAALIRGVERTAGFERCEAVLGGYLGTADTGAALLDAVGRVKRANPAATFCLDPVMGDDAEGLYVAEDVAAFVAERLVPAADILTPNLFELSRLAGHRPTTLDETIDAAERIRARGVRAAVVTSVPGGVDRVRSNASGQQVVSNLVVADGAWLATTPRLERKAKGAGDLLAALFLSWQLSGAGWAAALGKATASVFGILKATEPDALDMALIAAQEELVAPTNAVDATRIR